LFASNYPFGQVVYMKRFSDEEIVGVYVPLGMSAPLAEGEQIQCARLRCGRAEGKAGVRAHRWAQRQTRRGVIELCPRCHLELVTILSGG
jgi:hypothetical protein